MKDTDSDVRFYAAWALGMKGDLRVVPALMEALEDEGGHNRDWAAGTLGKIATLVRYSSCNLVAIVSGTTKRVQAQRLVPKRLNY